MAVVVFMNKKRKIIGMKSTRDHEMHNYNSFIYS